MLRAYVGQSSLSGLKWEMMTILPSQSLLVLDYQESNARETEPSLDEEYGFSLFT